MKIAGQVGLSRMTINAVVLLLLLVGFGVTPTLAETPPRCQGVDSYEYGLCLYRAGNFEGSERIFSRFLERVEPSPQAIRAHYFLGRALMKQKKWSEASAEWIRIFELDPGFYREWSCDFLLGECRRELGQG